jgi:predicted DNA-binding protein YlxM (UPF0122 family)
MKIKYEKYQEVIGDYNSGLSLAEVGRKFNVSHATIINILKKCNIKR